MNKFKYNEPKWHYLFDRINLLLIIFVISLQKVHVMEFDLIINDKNLTSIVVD